MNDPNLFPKAVQVQNPRYRVSGPHNPRHYVNPRTHNISDMQNNHMNNMAHSEIQMVPAHISQRQQAVYFPYNVAYQGTTNHPDYYPFSPQTASQAAVLMPYVNYPTNQQGMFYSQLTSPIQRTNQPQHPQNPPITSMVYGQNCYGNSLIKHTIPMDMAPSTQPLQQVSQHPSTYPMKTIKAYSRPLRKKVLIQIIDPKTGCKVDLINSLRGPPKADELEKMKIQIQFQSQVQSAIKKDDTKLSINNLNNEGVEQVRNEFQSQAKNMAIERTLMPSKAIEVVTQVSEEIIREVEEISVVSTKIEEVPVAINGSINIDIGGLTINTEDTTEREIKTTPTNTLPSSTTPLEVQMQNADVSNILEEPILLKNNTDNESVKSVKQNKTNIKNKNLAKLYANDGMKADNTIETNTIEHGIESKTNDILKQQITKENKNNNHYSKNEGEKSIIPKQEKLVQQPKDTQNKGIQHKPVVFDAALKLPSYIDNLPYAEGQWSFTNPTGKKMYSKLFLIQLGRESICQKKPDVLSKGSKLTKLSSVSQFDSLGRYLSGDATRFMPSYFKPDDSQKAVKRKSYQRKTEKPNGFHMPLCVREEVKLNQTENAWVPTAVKKATKSEVVKTKNEEEQKNNDVYKSVRSILNKITPDNMSSLIDHFKALPIDTIERLEKTIDLVFKKAIEEQSFVPLYSSLCSAMQSVHVRSKYGKTKSFKKLIISKCQSLFELDKAQEKNSSKKLTEINSCKDSEKKKKLQLEFEENEKELRKRSVGNCRFIGELFKQKILTPSIMMYCIRNLVTKKVEEPLECLCNLLKTVGEELEQSYNLDETFKKLKDLTSKDMKSKIPTRIKFMIQDVIDLRNDGWTPRRTDNKPKMINEIENDVKNEAIVQQSISPACNRPEKQNHCHKFRSGKKKSRRENWIEWNAVQNNAKYTQQNTTIDQSKLQGFKENISVKNVCSPKWSITTVNNMIFTISNPHTVLNDDNKSSNSPQTINTSRQPDISKTEGKQSMMSGAASIMPQFAQPNHSINYSSAQSKKTVEEPVLTLDPKIANKICMKCKNMLLEYEETQNLEDIIYSLSEDETSVICTRHEEFVKLMSLITLDSNPITLTTVAGNIFAELLSKQILSVEAITKGIDAVLKDWNDYLMDYPQFFSYIAAIIAPLLLSQNDSFDFKNLKDSCTSIRPDNSSKLFTEVLNKILISKEKQNIKEQLGGILWIYNKWLASEYVPLDIFMPDNQINKYFENDRIGAFLLSIAMYDKLKITIHSYNLLCTWISTNIKAEIIKYPQFVRALTIAIVIVCLNSNHAYEDFFDNVHVKLLTYYIRFETLPKPEIQAREIQCLYGIQIMSATLEHPGGMISKLFHKLYQNSIISKESFELWKKEDKFKAGFNEDLETKTMAVKLLNSFFLSVVANDSDEDETAE